MNLRMTYSTQGLFTLGEIRALVDQSKSVPDEATVFLKGTLESSDVVDSSADAIVIEWEDA